MNLFGNTLLEKVFFLVKPDSGRKWWCLVPQILEHSSWICEIKIEMHPPLREPGPIHHTIVPKPARRIAFWDRLLSFSAVEDVLFYIQYLNIN